MLSYGELLCSWRSGKGNGNWFRLRVIDRVFFRAAVWFARLRNRITGNRIINRLKSIIWELKTTETNRLRENGLERAKEMFTRFEENGVFAWAPQAKKWLGDSRYKFLAGAKASSITIT